MRTRLVLGLVLLVATVAALILGFGRVSPGQVGIRSDGSIVGPGLNLPPLRRIASRGMATGQASVPSSEGAVTSMRWTATWSIRPDASRDVAIAWRLRAPDDALSSVIDDALKEFGRERSGDVLVTAGVVAEAERVIAERFAGSGLDARITLMPASGAASGLRERLRKGPTWPVVIVGVDALDWRIAEPLMEAGRLRNLEKLIARGARADLRSARPMLSPLLWTTMATGRRPEDHGVCDFLAVDPETGRRMPITSAFRRVPALWNMAGEAGLDSAFVAWWATWPAEPVRGVIVSDRLAYSLAETGPAPATRLAYPPSFEKEALALRVRPTDVDPGLVGSFAKDAREGDERIAHLRRMLAGALTYHAVGMRLLEQGGTPLVGLYYELVDQAGHRFMHLAPPKRADVSEEDYAAFSGAVDAAYELQDRFLGEIVAKAPESAVIIVVSDHGFLSGADRLPGTADVEGQPARWHRLLGAFIAAGPPVDPATDLGIVTVEDIAPTVLHLLGLPVGEDMPGKARLALREPVLGVSSYDAVIGVAHEPAPASSPQLDAAALEELQALGYVGAGQAAATTTKVEVAESGRGTTATYHLNTAVSLLEAGRPDDALRQARAAIDREPLPDAWGVVSQALEAKGDLDGAIDAGQRAISLAPDMPEFAIRQVQLLVKVGRQGDASKLASRLPSGGTSAATLTAQAIAMDATGDDLRAMKLLQQALDIDPAFGPAVAALLPIAEERGGLTGLEPILRDALSRNPGLPIHREALGALALAGGHGVEAAKELRLALELDPTSDMARARLAMALMLTKDLDAAIVEARAVRIASPKQAEAWVMIGTVFARADQLEPGLECLTNARSLGATDASLDVAEAVTRIQLGDEEGAVRVLREGLARHPADPTLNELAFEFQRQGIIGR
jgi:predicted AlkP superfamily phosphohydrolase/phosphomutase/predicted Zn-dependent protease